jgi:hypothetical protein
LLSSDFVDKIAGAVASKRTTAKALAEKYKG